MLIFVLFFASCLYASTDFATVRKEFYDAVVASDLKRMTELYDTHRLNVNFVLEKNGQTPLEIAAGMLNPDLVAKLQEWGAVLQPKNNVPDPVLAHVWKLERDGKLTYKDLCNFRRVNKILR